MLLLDGAMGTELQRRGLDVSLPLWSARALVEHPEIVTEIHEEFAAAGADVLTTNTFRTHRRNLAPAGFGERAEELTCIAVELCRRVATERDLLVAGSISPLQECYSPDLSPGDASYAEHFMMANWLKEAGCDVLLVETMPSLREAVAATQAAKSMGLQTWVSVVPDGEPVNVRMLDGHPLSAAVSRLAELRPDALLVNCAPIELVEAGVATIRKAASGMNAGGYANNGACDGSDGWRFDVKLPVERFAEHCARLEGLGASIVGGCCGTTPEHIRAAKAALGRA